MFGGGSVLLACVRRGTWPNGHTENMGMMWTLPCRAANRADGLSSTASVAVTSRSLHSLHKGMSYQSQDQPLSMVSSWGLTSNVSVGALLQRAVWQKKRCGKPAAQQCPVGRRRFGTERGPEGVSWEVGGGNQKEKPHGQIRGDHRGLGKKCKWCWSPGEAGRAEPAAEMWPEGKGRTVLLEPNGYRIWKRQRPEERGMVLKGHVTLWIQEREPKKQACVWASKGYPLKGSKKVHSHVLLSPHGD